METTHQEDHHGGSARVTRRQIRLASQAYAAAARNIAAADANAVATTVHPRARFVPRCLGVDALARRAGRPAQRSPGGEP